ncbi:aldehyde dehydrogenase family protein [Croceicoccus sp. F390]|uniref:Aldehyde dehydrogenase n=1 Tax=Croceicoccus esteveae TaxID=3075597 RepID=A0ABU2ZFQ7_9SPHN|nr:aldehyde dehydrogenase family protein [Croceicoccus sp. F390]MDT0575191.1 aldehyde dehydrogenase family protein [Croceicoccus sp. F390]
MNDMTATGLIPDEYQKTFNRLQERSVALGASTAQERAAKIRQLYRAVYDLRHEISRAGQKELGMDGKMHLVPMKGEVEFVCERLAGWMAREDVEDVLALQGRKAYVLHEPKGVVLHLAAWNSPVLIALSPLIGMIAAGNAIVVKPSEITPRNAELVRKIIDKAELGDDIEVVTGGPEAAEALLRLPFNHICYVGNNRIGKLVMKAAAEHFAGVTLEMGGKNPVIVAADADIEDAAAKLAFARNLIAGQVCLAPDYILVDETVKDAFTEALTRNLSRMFDPEGKGAQHSKDLARIVNTRHAERIKQLVDDAVAKGAKVLHGGAFDVEQRFVAPTVISEVTDDMDIAHEEIFGPVLVVSGFTQRQDAIAQIAKRPKPLGLYIFTASRETADWYVAHTRAGTTVINNAVVQANIPTLPFGGVNHSGIGRIGGHAGFKEFSNPRSIVEDAFNPAEGPPMNYPPFAAETGMFIDMLLTPSD